VTAWETSFVAMSIALGGTVDDAKAALGEAGTVEASALLLALRDPSRANRAKALATAITAITLDIERARLT
jgi:hypothetical protein